jgi:phosphoserine phosphatase
MSDARGRSDPLSPAVRALVMPLLAGAPSAAVALDADGTLWRGDVGEDFLRFLAVEDRLPRFPGRSDVYLEYERRVAQDPASGFAFAVEAMEGLDERELGALCRQFVGRRYGGRIFPFARALVAELAAAGHAVWVVSASPVWPVIAGAELLGIPPDRVIGARCEIAEGRLTRRVSLPIPTLEGKVTRLVEAGIRPALAGGNSVLDIPLLEAADRAFVVVPHGEAGEIARVARQRGWPVQHG